MTTRTIVLANLLGQINILVERKKVKKVRLKVFPNGIVKLSAPYGVSDQWIDNYVSDKRFLLNTVHMIKSGKWIPKSTRIISKLGYEINFLERGYISFSDRIKLNGLYSWASRRLPVKLRRIIKKIMSFFGFHFASKS